MSSQANCNGTIPILEQAFGLPRPPTHRVEVSCLFYSQVSLTILQPIYPNELGKAGPGEGSLKEPKKQIQVLSTPPSLISKVFLLNNID